MFIAKEILLNSLISIPGVRSLARIFNNKTGINGEANYAREVYEMYTRFSNINGKKILELGPGHTYQCAVMALQNGAASVDFVDIEKLIDQAVLDEYKIPFQLYDGKNLPFENESFDYVWSHTVYEHLRYPETTVAETYRILKPGGVAVHWIDMRNHFEFDIDNPNVFGMLQYSPRIWKAMTWNRSTYVNCLRFSDWIALHQKMGFTVVETDRQVSTVVKEMVEAKKIPYLQKYSLEDACTAQMMLVIRK